jgi:hypothetical protein
MWRVRLHDRELEAVEELASRRQILKQGLAIRTKKFDRSRNDWEITFFGLMGEAAVARALCLAPDNSVLAGGDGGIDLVINGTTLQVKTPLANITRDFLYFNDESGFSCDFGILCNIDRDEVSVLIRGAISRADFIGKSIIKNFGYGERLCVHVSDLSPMDGLITAVQSFNNLVIGERC